MMTQTEITEAMRSVVAFLALTIKTTMPVIPAPTAAPVHTPGACLPACDTFADESDSREITPSLASTR